MLALCDVICLHDTQMPLLSVITLLNARHSSGHKSQAGYR